jgi:hypothetical protein
MLASLPSASHTHRLSDGGESLRREALLLADNASLRAKLHLCNGAAAAAAPPAGCHGQGVSALAAAPTAPAEDQQDDGWQHHDSPTAMSPVWSGAGSGEGDGGAAGGEGYDGAGDSSKPSEVLPGTGSAADLTPPPDDGDRAFAVPLHTLLGSGSPVSPPGEWEAAPATAAPPPASALTCYRAHAGSGLWIPCLDHLSADPVATMMHARDDAYVC